jgi:hypothetical protein
MDGLVADWSQRQGSRDRHGQAGVQPAVSERDRLTGMLAQACRPSPGETQGLGSIRANHRRAVPGWGDQRPSTRRAGAGGQGWDAVPQAWGSGLAGQAERQRWRDSHPGPLLGQPRSQRPRAFAGEAAEGSGAARQLPDWGETPLSGLPVDGWPVLSAWLPAPRDERPAAQAVLDRVPHGAIVANQGCRGQAWPADLRGQATHRLWTSQRGTQAHPNPAAGDARLNRVRVRLESPCNQWPNPRRGLEPLRAQTPPGRSSRLIANGAAVLRRFLLTRPFGIAVLSFSIDSVSISL